MQRRGPSAPAYTLATLSLAVVSFSLVQSMSIPVIGAIGREYDASTSAATWVLTAYLLAATVATPMMGRIGDAVGKVRMLVVSLLALCLGSLMAAVAPTIEVLIVARVIQGLGGGVLPLSFGIVRDTFPPGKVAAGVAFMNSLMAVGMAAGIVVAGPVLRVFDLTWLFGLPAVLTGVGVVAAVRLRTRPHERASARISPVSAVLLAGWLVLFLVAVSQAPARGWWTPVTVAMLTAAVVLAAAWVWSELHARVPVVDMRLMRMPPVAVANLVAVLVGFGSLASYAFIPQFVQTPISDGFGFGASVTLSGLMLLPAAIAMFLTGLLAVPLATRVGTARALVLGGVLAAVGTAVLLIGRAHEVWVYVSSGLTGFGIGLVFACLAAVIVQVVPASQTGVATGMNANLRTLGGAIGTAVLATIVASHPDPSTGHPAEAGYLISFALLVVVFALAALAAAALVPAARRSVPATAPSSSVEETASSAARPRK